MLILLGCGSVLILFFVYLFASVIHFRRRAQRNESETMTGRTSVNFPATNMGDLPEKLSKLIQIRSVSRNDYSKIDMQEYKKIPLYFQSHFPGITAAAEYIQLNDFAHIFHWKGSDPDLKPGLLLAHFDVVPADDEQWNIGPFSGRIDEDFVWGRGSLDTKCTLVGILAAAEQLIEEGFNPARSWYFAFGGDEETFGIEGAQKIAAFFEDQDIQFEFLLDEGAIVADGMLSDVKRPIALFGISEKGYADIVIEVEGRGGHASMPVKNNPASLLSSAVARIERKKPGKRITYAVRKFLHALIPHVPIWKGMVYANTRIFNGLIKRAMSKSPQTIALIQTTQALTLLDAGNAANVIPLHAKGVYNVRILPGDTVSGTLNRFRKTVSDPEITIALLDEREVNDPLQETPLQDPVSHSIQGLIKTIFPEAVVAPFLSTVTTDSKYYRNCTERIFRFVPIVLNPRELSLIHGIDERISLENLNRVFQFYIQLMRM